jgi:hypothetical protein
MDFVKSQVEYDENGQEIVINVNYNATLENGIAQIFLVTETEKTAIRTQPWKPNGDGSRIDWTSVEEVVEWFKETD